ncbi:MAG: hypothetical protein KAS93_00795 [Gammaproteobacteria bacterium]|nr:hypothetical protein [Gammaproteobacteria bacterium]
MIRPFKNKARHFFPCKLSYIDLLVSIVFSLGVISCLYAIQCPQRYTNFIHGYLTLLNASKTREFVLVTVFFVAALLFLTVINKCYLVISEHLQNNEKALIAGFRAMMIVLSVPAISTFALYVWKNKILLAWYMLLGYVLSFILLNIGVFVFMRLFVKGYRCTKFYMFFYRIHFLAAKILTDIWLMIKALLSYRLSFIEIFAGLIFAMGVVACINPFAMQFSAGQYVLIFLVVMLSVLICYLSFIYFTYKIVGVDSNTKGHLFVVGYRKQLLILVFPALIYPARIICRKTCLQTLVASLQGCRPSLVLLFVSLVLALMLSLRFRDKNCSARDLLRVIATSTILCVFLLFDGSALTLILTRLSTSVAVMAQPVLKYAPYIPLFIGGFIYLFVCHRHNKLGVFKRKLYSILCYSQIGLPFLLLALKPAFWNVNGDIVSQTYFSYAFIIFLAMLIGCFLVVVIGFNIRCKEKDYDWQRLMTIISGVSFVSIIVYLYLSSHYLSSQYQVVPDAFIKSPYEMAKYYLSWHELYWYHRLPYLDLNYAHGLSQLAVGFINWLFFHENAGMVTNSIYLAGSILIMIIYFSARFLTEKVVALVLSSVAYIGSIIVMFPLLHRKMLVNPCLWCLVWGVGIFLVVMVLPSLGVPLFLASLPFAIFMLYLSCKHQLQKLIFCLIMITCLMVMLALFTPAFHIIKYFIVFLFVNAGANPVVWGLPFSLNPGHMPIQIYRFLWVPISMSALIMLWRELSHDRRDMQTLFITSVMVLFAIFSIPYSFGRIDLGVLTRLGEITLLESALLLILMYLRTPNNSARVYVGVYLMTLLFVPFTLLHVSLSNIIEYPQVLVRPTTQQIAKLNETAKLKFPYLSGTISHTSQLKLLADTQHFLRLTLARNENFANFTNGGVYSFPLQYPIMMPEINTLNMAAIAIQKRTIAALKKYRVNVILLAPRVRILAENPFALRNGLLYQYLLKYYVPIRYKNLIFLVAKTKVRSRVFNESAFGRLLLNGNSGESYIEDDNHNIGLWEQAFPIATIRRTPAAWGQSFQFLQKRMILLSPVLKQVRHEGNKYVYDIAKGVIHKRAVAFVSFRVMCKAHLYNNAKISWANGSGNHGGSIKMVIKNGVMLAPLYVNPRWYLRRSARLLAVQVLNNNLPCVFSDVRLWGTKDGS